MRHSGYSLREITELTKTTVDSSESGDCSLRVCVWMCVCQLCNSLIE